MPTFKTPLYMAIWTKYSATISEPSGEFLSSFDHWGPTRQARAGKSWQERARAAKGCKSGQELTGLDKSGLGKNKNKLYKQQTR